MNCKNWIFLAFAWLLPNLFWAQDGLNGVYFSGTRFDNYVRSQTDKSIDFDWPRNTSPGPQMPASYFSVRWTGFITPEKTGLYQFTALVDDGIRLYIDNRLVMDAWDLHDSERFTGNTNLIAGVSYPIKVEYFNDMFEGEIHLKWKIPGKDNFQVIEPAFFSRKPKQNQPIIPAKPLPKPQPAPKTKPRPAEPEVTVKPRPKDSLDQFIPQNIWFVQSKSIMLDGSKPELDRLAAMLIRHPEIQLTIEGHTDNIGDAEKNRILSLERARVTARYLVEKGVSGKRIAAFGYGSAKPLSTENSAEGHAKNRRVVFILR